MVDGVQSLWKVLASENAFPALNIILSRLFLFLLKYFQFSSPLKDF